MDQLLDLPAAKRRKPALIHCDASSVIVIVRNLITLLVSSGKLACERPRKPYPQTKATKTSLGYLAMTFKVCNDNRGVAYAVIEQR